MAEKAYPNLIHYNKFDKGTHFAAWEQTKVFVDKMRAAFKSLRKQIAASQESHMKPIALFGVAVAVVGLADVVGDAAQPSKGADEDARAISKGKLPSGYRD